MNVSSSGVALVAATSQWLSDQASSHNKHSLSILLLCAVFQDLKGIGLEKKRIEKNWLL